MSELLCRWINENVKLEARLSGASIAQQSSNGYIFGELLHKYGFQDDFAHFSKTRSSEAKLNNFTRLQPTLQVLEIPFTFSVARDIMMEKSGAATCLLYQLFVALKRNKQPTGHSLVNTRGSGKLRLEKVETGIFKECLKQQTPRQVDLDFEALIRKFHDRQQQHEETVLRERAEEAERLQGERREACQQALKKLRLSHKRQSQMYFRLKPLSAAELPRGNASRLAPDSKHQTTHSQHSVAKATQASIGEFETTKRDGAAGRAAPSLRTTQIEEGTEDHYLIQIRGRVEGISLARQERERRRRRVLVDQMGSLQEQEEARQERLLVERLTRQCQQERRIATQLMHIRREKDVIRNNRMVQQKQLEEQKMREFEEALNMEAEEAGRQAASQRTSLLQSKALQRRLLAERAELSRQQSTELCRHVLLCIVDLSAKMALYRELTQRLIPAKIVRDWKTLFVAGKSLELNETDEEREEERNSISVSSLTPSTEVKWKSSSQVLDCTDMREYQEACCDWEPLQGQKGQVPSSACPILSHVVYRLLDMVDPPTTAPTPSQFPSFLLKACFLGKPFTGKSSTLLILEQSLGVRVLCVEVLLSKASHTFLSEKSTLRQKQLAASPEGRPGGVSSEGLSPAITLEPSSNVQLTQAKTEQGEQVEDQQVAMARHDHDMESLVQQSDISSTELSQLSSLAALGYRVHTCIASGQAVDDVTIIDLIAEELRSLPDGSAWVLDGFPATVAQARLLGSALSGSDRPCPHLPREFALLEEPEGIDEKLHAASGLDLILHFKASTEGVLQRASMQLAGSADAVPSKSTQLSQKLSQLQHRILGFEERWPALVQWGQKFRILSVVDANQEQDVVCSAALERVQELINKAKQAGAMRRLGVSEDLLACGSMTDLTTQSLMQMGGGAMQKPRRRRRRPSSAESPICKFQDLSKRRGGKAVDYTSRRRKCGEVEQAVVQLSFLPPNASAVPGSKQWVYCSLPLSKDLDKCLAHKWPAVESTYDASMKAIFQLLRREREAMCRYLHRCRKEFCEYLQRPDHKQEFVSQWQQSYNALQPHLRCEDVVKAELHHRVDDLCEQLWDMCEHRRSEAEAEQRRVQEDCWLSDHCGLLSNHFICLMQAELDRALDTLLLLRDYYQGMQEMVPSQLPQIERLPLIELSVTGKQQLPPSATSSMQSMEDSAAVDGSGSGAHVQLPSPAQELDKRRIPLLPRHPMAEPSEERAKKKPGTGPASSSPQPPSGDTASHQVDEKLIMHACNVAISTTSSIVSADMKVLDAALEKKKPLHKPQPDDVQPVKNEKATGKGKKGKSPAAKKGKATPAKAAPPEPPPTSTSPAPSPEELSRQKTVVSLCREHRAAIQHEEERLLWRLELIKERAVHTLTDLKAKSQVVWDQMEKWTAQCFMAERDSVESLSAVLGQAVEQEDRVQPQLLMPGPLFKMDQNVITIVSSPPAMPAPALDPASTTTFTLVQLQSLVGHFSHMAPSGLMLMETFVQTLLSHIRASAGQDIFPQAWRVLSKPQAQQIATLLSVDGCVNWHRFVLCVAEHWCRPCAVELAVAAVQLATAAAAAAAVNSCLTRRHFMAAPLWWTETGSSVSSQQQADKEPFREVLFEMFADSDSNEVDYRRMLLHLSADPDHRKGFFNALSAIMAKPLSPDKYSDGLTVVLQDFYEVLAYGTSGEIQPALTMDTLFEVFSRLSPGSPNEARLGLLLADAQVMQWVDSCSNYAFPDVLGLVTQQGKEDSCNN